MLVSLIRVVPVVHEYLETELITTTEFLCWLFLSILLALFSRNSLSNPQCHGFYRFFVFISIAGLLVVNSSHWLAEILSPLQLLSNLLLLLSILFVSWGLYLLKEKGGHRDGSINAENFDFENTGELITSGIYQYIRHPMYSSLLLLTWGALLKNIDPLTLGLTVFSTVSLALAIKAEERENQAFFGEAYQRYMQYSKKVIPFIY